ncbi:uncharacterized protein B0H18DRAFT_985384 [Fomitopsis serialis]|uniref:uncharacterized protein n=1 Tax=Fomitopsis serialis TaxID=139415 RepID=UPI002008E35F|nr:uncharacterized protein B0H18DRAFT_985384 [Neoantrodia serialis]KAH9933062.1 hypothetical protein B0H18DRAFT_985384 [Neoantrodia serialis]
MVVNAVLSHNYIFALPLCQVYMRTRLTYAQQSRNDNEWMPDNDDGKRRDSSQTPDRYDRKRDHSATKGRWPPSTKSARDGKTWRDNRSQSTNPTERIPIL